MAMGVHIETNVDSWVVTRKSREFSVLALSGHSSVICPTVCLAAPQSKAGNGVSPHLSRESAHPQLVLVQASVE